MSRPEVAKLTTEVCAIPLSVGRGWRALWQYCRAAPTIRTGEVSVRDDPKSWPHWNDVRRASHLRAIIRPRRVSSHSAFVNLVRSGTKQPQRS